MAEIIDSLSNYFGDEEYISQSFACFYYNNGLLFSRKWKEGVVMSEKFKKFSKYYENNYPITAYALKKISDYYLFEAKIQRKLKR
ncbi:hypothetical protein [Mycoplasma struthionis]|uniref:Uncharacterized protein n=1 Tax=Mycoplasma struthionis TaxID=538220 RepID=A0A502M8G2_9MOLU|nr:hypothetical protein [Mycoplasma struthionis]TPI01173.1 hypothetical protein FJM01_03100 [Mycoplasma struthionis]